MLPAIPKGQFPAFYNNVREAIAKCHHVDECKDIANKAEAMVAYYRQANDDETVQRFYEIKLRAWRRIGELLLSDPEIAAGKGANEKYRIACERMDNEALRAMRAHDVKLAIKIACHPEEDFEGFVGEAGGSLTKMAQLSNRDTRLAKARASAWKEDVARLRGRGETHRWFGEAPFTAPHSDPETPEEAELIKAADAADEKEHEVGLTLQRKFRRPLRVFGFYISFEAHEQLRKAGFDRRCTMHHILRDALDMWFVANGLPAVAAIPDSDDSIEEAA